MHEVKSKHTCKCLCVDRQPFASDVKKIVVSRGHSSRWQGVNVGVLGLWVWTVPEMRTNVGTALPTRTKTLKLSRQQRVNDLLQCQIKRIRYCGVADAPPQRLSSCFQALDSMVRGREQFPRHAEAFRVDGVDIMPDGSGRTWLMCRSLP
jgi:hypothetical protein